MDKPECRAGENKNQTDIFSIFHVMDDIKLAIVKKSLDNSKYIDPYLVSTSTTNRNDKQKHSDSKNPYMIEDCDQYHKDDDNIDKNNNDTDTGDTQKYFSKNGSTTFGQCPKNVFVYDELIYRVPEDFFYKCIGNLECLRSSDMRNVRINNCCDDNTCLFWSDQIKNSRNLSTFHSETTKTGVYKKSGASSKNQGKSRNLKLLYFHDGISRSPLYWTLRFVRSCNYSMVQKPKCICKNGSRNRDGVTCINPWHYIIY